MPPAPADAAALVQKVERLLAAVRARDRAAMLASFPEGEDVAIVFGAAELLRRADLATFFDRIASAPSRFDIALTLSASDVTDRLAFLAFLGTFREIAPGGDVVQERPYRLTAVFRRDGDRWTWIHCHASVRVDF
ncbi:MAG TPA: nuclear transport factor 2 family protein [Candidatus Thermoplasmatota archaeon]|nr:nuclear transport factor 2 family protein [Candidatus Thermoplasmatota archaeon]